MVPTITGEKGSLYKDEIEDAGPEATVLIAPCRIEVPDEITELLLRSISSLGRSDYEVGVYVLKE